VNHPANVYLREDRIVPPLDEWLGRLFEPERLDRTLDALAAAQCPPSREEMVQAEVRRQVVDADRKLARHRAALEAGADPAVVTAWIREVQAAKAEAEAQLRRLSQSPARTLDRDELVQITRALGDMVRVLADADPARKAFYAGLGLRLTYHPDKRKVLVGQAPAPVIGQQFVSEGGLELLRAAGHPRASKGI
jgi:site-specific DNA recombinase